MAVRIRLTRVGRDEAADLPLVVADSRSARDSRSIETIGHYNPRTDPIELHIDAEQGEGLARQGRPAVGHGRPPLPQTRASCRPRRSRPAMAAKELVEYVAKSLVDDPDAVKVEVVQDQDGTVIELHVAEDDMGKVIGRNGSVAKALRTLLKVTAARDGEPVSLEIV